MTLSKKRQDTLDGMPKEGFHFDEKTHLYVLDGKPLTGVTTILSVISKPALIQWAADETAKHLGWYDTRYIVGDELAIAEAFLESQRRMVGLMDKETYLKFLAAARVQHAQRKKMAGDVGTIAHDWIEQYVKAKINGTQLPTRFETIGHMTDNFVKWAEGNKVKFLASELRVYSRKHWYAGTLDILCEINGKVFIVDVKTGGGIYPEHYFQMGGYQIAVEEMAEFPHKIEGHIVLNIKKDGTFASRDYYNYELNKESFLAALTLYRAIEQIKI